MWETIQEWVIKILEWLLEVVLYIPKFIWQQTVQAVVDVLSLIPVPGWLVGVNIFGGISSEMAFFLRGFAIPEGMGILGAAMVIKFLIRRIPIIG